MGSAAPDNDRAITILVTGFGPFQAKFPVNPSYEIARSLPPSIPQASADHKPIQIIGYGSPIRVCYNEAKELIPELLEAPKAYAAERCAHRTGYMKHKDLDGCFPQDEQAEKDFDDCPNLMETSLNYENVLQEWQSAISHAPEISPARGADCRPSDNAGNFLCDYTYFNSLVWYGRRNKKIEGGHSADRPVMFLHVPAESDEKTLEQGAAVAVALIQAMVKDFVAHRYT
ncbi:hypothetical protein LTR17_002622 [Elasticomyces elasticus]|nr:hypothetical protein LTR17_002622 [Elasticomyces elasticus]